MRISLLAIILIATPAFADLSGDAAQGQMEFKMICATCHTNVPNHNGVGPSLFGVIGRHAGSAPDFDYSQAMRSAPIVWDDQTLDQYLSNPKGVVPGNKMPYQGVKKPDERREIIAYLNTLH